MCSLFICNSCKPFIVVNPNITGIQGWDFLRQADISPGMWCSVLIMLLSIIWCWMKSKYCWMQTHTHTHTQMHFPKFSSLSNTSIFQYFLKFSRTVDPPTPWKLLPADPTRNRAVPAKPCPNWRSNRKRFSCILSFYKVVCYTASNYWYTSFSIPSFYS